MWFQPVLRVFYGNIRIKKIMFFLLIINFTLYFFLCNLGGNYWWTLYVSCISSLLWYFYSYWSSLWSNLWLYYKVKNKITYILFFRIYGINLYRMGSINRRIKEKKKKLNLELDFSVFNVERKCRCYIIIVWLYFLLDYWLLLFIIIRCKYSKKEQLNN